MLIFFGLFGMDKFFTFMNLECGRQYFCIMMVFLGNRMIFSNHIPSDFVSIGIPYTSNNSFRIIPSTNTESKNLSIRHSLFSSHVPETSPWYVFNAVSVLGTNSVSLLI